MLGEKLSKSLSLVAIIAAVFLLVLTAKELKLYGYVGRDVVSTSQINVSGTGEAFAIPDVATFTFAVSKESPTVETAQKDVNERTAKILNFLKESGVEEKDIKTYSYNINPVYDYSVCYSGYCPPQNRSLRGYEVYESISVKVREIGDAGKIVSGIGELGVTDLSGLSFMVDDDDAVIAEAREKAIVDAKKKAKELAKDLGVKLTRVVSFSENSGGYPPIYYAKDMAMGMGGAESAPRAELPAGENKYTVQVYINYEIK